MSDTTRRIAKTTHEIRLGNEGAERVVIPAGTEVLIEQWYIDGEFETVDVSAWYEDMATRQDFWVFPEEIELLEVTQ